MLRQSRQSPTNPTFDPRGALRSTGDCSRHDREFSTTWRTGRKRKRSEEGVLYKEKSKADRFWQAEETDELGCPFSCVDLICFVLVIDNLAVGQGWCLTRMLLPWFGFERDRPSGQGCHLRLGDRQTGPSNV